MRLGRALLSFLLVLLLVVGTIVLATVARQPRAGHVLDEALTVGRDGASFPAAGEDYFHGMDGSVSLTPDEIKGRDTWLVWSGGNDLFWDKMAILSFGTLDFLKTLSSYPGLKADRDHRWEYLGLVNEPCFQKASGPDPKRYGLWLDTRTASCPSDPFEDAQKYPGVRIGARGQTVDVGSYYGYPSGVVGLRIFPNPAFNAAAAARWDPVRYYNDPSYYNSKDLVRPYRVGMTCALCHVGPNPVHPPVNPDHPRWDDLSSNVGAQYFWIDRIFSWQSDPRNFLFQLFHTSRPGSLDTSLVSTDNINNPRTMNAVYQLGPRLEIAQRWGRETLAGGGVNNRQFNDYVHSGPLTKFFQAPATVWTPHVLKDGSDSVGALGALNRVFLNIGTFSEEWLLHFNPLVGGKSITPIEITTARRNSGYFQATENQTLAMAEFFLKTTGPHHLRDAPGGAAYLSENAAVLTRGKIVFADTCARCHSSKLPAPALGLDPNGCTGKAYLVCWNKYWSWTKTDDFKEKMRKIVLTDTFLEGNALTADFRVPVTLLHTNACSPLATNAIAGNIWDNFSSQSYKDLPSVGDITWYDPVTGAPRRYHMPAGGRGYTRVPSLVSIWSTAPFLLNNTVGKFEESPSVDARMRSFQSSIEQLLWPEKRAHDAVLGAKVPGLIDRTTASSSLHIAGGYLPEALQKQLPLSTRLAPWLFGDGGVEIGPLPAGTPVDLLANLDPLSEDPNLLARLEHEKQVGAVLLRLAGDLRKLPHDASDDQARAIFANLVQPLLGVSKCPDFVVNRGHYFGTGYVEPGASDSVDEPGLPDADKRALIAFLKTF